MSIIYLNGSYMPEEQATISPLDRGFIFGDGVYELIPVYGGNLFRIGEHLKRLDNSLDAIRLDNPHSHDEWQSILDQLIKHNGGGDQSVYLQITRGIAKRDHAIPDKVKPTVFVMSNPLLAVTENIKTHGVATITCNDFRWQNCHIKSTSLIANVLLRQMAVDNDASEAILIRNGAVTEGAASNIFMVQDNVLITPPKGPLLLPGITRDLVLEIAQQNNIPYSEQSINEGQLEHASEIMLTSSTKEILAVTLLNHQPVGSGTPGPIYLQLYELYQAYKQKLRAGTMQNTGN